MQNGGCFKWDYLNARRLKPAATNALYIIIVSDRQGGISFAKNL